VSLNYIKLLIGLAGELHFQFRYEELIRVHIIFCRGSKSVLSPELQEQIMWQMFQGWLQAQISVHRSNLEFIW
jgi:hypothetical protein